ncbi:MAG: hypothetical protein M3539_08985, partial [Acidobacteriota bacterium]|nr:hypothetical protein [Acidobacteriota bacterium]
PQLQVEKLQLGFQARGMALGFFVWNRDAKKQVAILGDNGTTQIFHSGELRDQPFTELELAERGKARLRPKRTDEDVESVVGWQPSAKQGWDAAREFHTNTDTGAPGNRLFKAHLSGAEIDNLMFMDSRSQIKVVQQFSQKYAPESVSIQGTTDISEASLSLIGQPTAILSMPPKINGERSLIMLQSGTSDLATVPDNVVVASSVDRFDDPDPATASACTGAADDCSLRGAIQRANANATDPTNPAANAITLPVGTYVLTRNGAGGCVNGDNNSTGDLELNNSTTITGGGMLTTVVRQTGTGSGAFLGDRVMCLNTAIVVNRDYVFSGFTIAGGFDRSQIGGGGLVGGAKDNFLSLTNIRITNNDNTAAANYAGGGLSITGGDVNIINSVIGGPTAADSDPAVSNDRTDLTRGNYAGTAGGGIGYSPGDPIVQLPSVGTLTVTGTTVQGNKANSGATGGGGLDLFQHNSGTGSFVINGNSIIDSNSALNGNGGGVIIESGPLTVDSSTFTNNSTVVANTRGGAIYLSGGGMSFGSSTSFSNNSVGAGVVLGKCISVNTGGSASTGVFVTGGNNNINDNVEVLPNGVWTNNAGTSVTFLNLTLAEGTFVGNNSTLTINQDLNLNSAATADTPIFTGGSGTHTITGNLNIVEGTYTATSGTTNLAGNFNKTGGTFTHNSGIFNFNGAGAQSISGSPTFNILTVNKGSGTLTLLANIGVASNLNLSAGTFDLQNFTANRTAAGGGTMTLSNGSLLKIGGTNGLPTNYLTHSIGATSTVEYSGTAQTITVPNSAQSYGHLTTSGSGTKTLAGAITAAGNVTIGTGTVLAGGTNSFTVGGNWINNVGNSGFTSSGAGVVNFNGSAASLTGATTFTNLTISKTAGQTLTLGAPIIVNGNLLLTTGNLAAASNAISLAGNWTNNSGASAFSGTNTTTFTGGTANTIGGTASTAFGSLTVNKSGGTLSLLTNITIAGDLTVTAGTFDLSSFTANRTAAGGTLSVSNGATVTIGGTNALPSNFSTNTFGATSITNFTGTNQNVAGITYGHLNLSGAGTKTLLGAATIAGSLTIASGTTFDAGANNISIAGNWTNNGGTFLPGTGTVTFNNTTAAQGITGSATTQTFFSITVNKTGQILNVAGSTTALDINGN